MFNLFDDHFMKISMSKVHRCICSELLPSLSPLPPDMEALRVHMLLPLFHECLQAKYFEVLQVPFAATVLSLKPEAGKALGMLISYEPNELNVSSTNF